jgi:hypothetical protein
MTLTPNYERPPFSPVPKGGRADVARAKGRVQVESAEEKAKREAKRLDGNRCRWPHARGEKAVCQKLRLESAHWKAKGMGGDAGLRSKVEDLISFDIDVHQGPKSLHSGHKKVVPLDPKLKMRGPCEFYERATLKSPWVLVGRELHVGVLER